MGVTMKLLAVHLAILGAVIVTVTHADNGDINPAEEWDNRIRLAKKNWDNRIRLAKKWDNRIRLAKKYMDWDKRIRLAKRSWDSRIRLAKKDGIDYEHHTEDIEDRIPNQQNNELFYYGEK